MIRSNYEIFMYLCTCDRCLSNIVRYENYTVFFFFFLVTIGDRYRWIFRHLLAIFSAFYVRLSIDCGSFLSRRSIY